MLKKKVIITILSISFVCGGFALFNSTDVVAKVYRDQISRGQESGFQQVMEQLLQAFAQETEKNSSQVPTDGEEGLTMSIGSPLQGWTKEDMNYTVGNGEWLAYRIDGGRGNDTIVAKVLRGNQVVEEFEIAPNNSKTGMRHTTPGEYKIELSQKGNGTCTGYLTDVHNRGYFQAHRN